MAIRSVCILHAKKIPFQNRPELVYELEFETLHCTFSATIAKVRSRDGIIISSSTNVFSKFVLNTVGDLSSS